MESVSSLTLCQLIDSRISYISYVKYILHCILFKPFGNEAQRLHAGLAGAPRGRPPRRAPPRAARARAYSAHHRSHNREWFTRGRGTTVAETQTPL